MKRRILIELDVEDEANGMIKDITNLVMERIDSNVEFKISQEILPEKSSGELKIPVFLKGGVKDGKANY